MKSNKEEIGRASVSAYLSEIKKNLAHGDSTEHTHRPALKKLIESLCEGVTATNEPKRVSAARRISSSLIKQPLGHVETKDIGINIDEMERGKGPHGEQFIKYLRLPTGF